MVNLTFCRLDVFLIRSSLITPKHNTHLFPFISLQRDDHSCWNFFVDLLRTSDSVLSKLPGSFGHLLFGFRFPGEIFVFADLREDQVIFDDHGSWFRFAGCCSMVSWRIFSNNRWRPFRSWPLYQLNSFEVIWIYRRILFTSVPLYYFDLKSDWLPWLTYAFGSPPEDLLFRYLLFVPIE